MARHALTFTMLVMMVTLGCGSELDEDYEAELEVELVEGLGAAPGDIAVAEIPGAVPVSDEQEGICEDPNYPYEITCQSSGSAQVCVGDVLCACTNWDGKLKIENIVAPPDQCPSLLGWVCQPFAVVPGQECAAAGELAPEPIKCSSTTCVEADAGFESTWSPDGCCIASQRYRTCCCEDTAFFIDDDELPGAWCEPIGY